MDCRVFKQKIGLLNHLNSQLHRNCYIPNNLIPPLVVEKLNKLPEVKPPAVVDGAGAGIGASDPLGPCSWTAALSPQEPLGSFNSSAFQQWHTCRKSKEPSYFQSSPKQTPPKSPRDCSRGLTS